MGPANMMSKPHENPFIKKFTSVVSGCPSRYSLSLSTLTGVVIAVGSGLKLSLVSFSAVCAGMVISVAEGAGVCAYLQPGLLQPLAWFQNMHDRCLLPLGLVWGSCLLLPDRGMLALLWGAALSRWGARKGGLDGVAAGLWRE